MQHLDEGTIHAWLDGALAPNEASAAEAHVQTCEQCARVVAEARGLIAASSRILGALDEVPAVQAVASESLRIPMARQSRGYWWRRAGLGYAAAATALLAVGTTLVLRNTSPNAALEPAVVAADQATPSAPLLAAEVLQDSAQSGRRSSVVATAPSRVANEGAAERGMSVARSTKEANALKEEFAIDRIVQLPGAMPRPKAPPAAPPVVVRSDVGSKMVSADKAVDPERAAVVQGRVVDAASGAPVTGALVSVDTNKGLARTDSAGKFQLQAVPAGQQTVSVRALGFQTAQHQLAIAPRDSVNLAFALQKSTLQLEQVVTTGATLSGARQRGQAGLADSLSRRAQAASPVLRLDEIRANSADILGCYTLRSSSAKSREADRNAEFAIPTRVELDVKAQERAHREEPVVNRARALEGPGRADSWRFVGDSLELVLIDGTRRTAMRFARNGVRWISDTYVMEPCSTR